MEGLNMTGENNIAANATNLYFETPLEHISQGHLVVLNGAPKLMIGSEGRMTQLVRAQFERPHPDITVQDGKVQLRYPGYSLLNWLVYWRQPRAELILNASIPWSIEGRGGISSFHADLREIKITGIDLHGGVSHFLANLPSPSGTVSIRIVGGVSELLIYRPVEVPVRIQVRGGIGSLIFDEQQFGSIGGQPKLESPGFREANNRYDIQISGGAGKFITGVQAE
jgi:hypothetical protein